MIISDVDFVDDLKIELLTGGTSRTGTVTASATARAFGDSGLVGIRAIQNSSEVVRTSNFGDISSLSPLLVGQVTEPLVAAGLLPRQLVVII